MTAATHRRSNMTAFCKAVGGEMSLDNRLGAAEDSRLDQPPRVIWVPVEDSGEVRECTCEYDDAIVHRERSFEYKVHLRGQDEAACADLEQRLFAALIDVGATEPAIEIGQGDFRPGSSAAEQGCLVIWRIRVWMPLVYRLRTTVPIRSVKTNVNVPSAPNTIEAPP